MAERKQLDFFLLRYMPNAVRGEFVNIALIMIEVNPVGFADVRFIPDWKTVERVDPDVDIEMLQTMERYIRGQMRDPGSRQVLLRKMEDSFSNLIQLSPRSICVTEEPAKEIEALTALYFRTVHPPSLRAPSARSRIWQEMRTAFEQEGILGAVMTDIAMEQYTMPGDPLRLDFGYYAKTHLKFLQAVSLKGNLGQANYFASRSRELVNAISLKTGAAALLMAVVDDDLDRKNDEIAFALKSMTDNGVQLSVVTEMPNIARQARVELGL